SRIRLLISSGMMCSFDPAGLLRQKRHTPAAFAITQETLASELQVLSKINEELVCPLRVSPAAQPAAQGPSRVRRDFRTPHPLYYTYFLLVVGTDGFPITVSLPLVWGKSSSTEFWASSTASSSEVASTFTATC